MMELAWFRLIRALFTFALGLLTLKRERIGKIEFGCCWAILLLEILIFES